MQDPGSALDPRFTVRDAIAEGMDAFAIGASHEERTQRVADLMRSVSLDPETMWRYPHEFSGGQRQRICIARALAVDPAAADLRRGHLGARRVDPGADPQPAG